MFDITLPQNRYKYIAICYTDFNNTRRFAKVTKFNKKTIWVEIMIGAKSKAIIKRHIDKHHVRFV